MNLLRGAVIERIDRHTRWNQCGTAIHANMKTIANIMSASTSFSTHVNCCKCLYPNTSRTILLFQGPGQTAYLSCSYSKETLPTRTPDCIVTHTNVKTIAITIPSASTVSYAMYTRASFANDITLIRPGQNNRPHPEYHLPIPFRPHTAVVA